MKFIKDFLSLFKLSDVISIQPLIEKKDMVSTPTKKVSEKTQSICIDTTEPAQNAKNDLLTNWKYFTNYPEFLILDEADKLPILEYIYGRWAVHGINEEFYKKYSKYDKDLLTFIYMKENNRLNIRIKLYQMCSNWYRLFWNVNGSDDNSFNGAICHFEDILKFTDEFDYWENNHYYGLDIISIHTGLILNIKEFPVIKLFHNGELHIFHTIKDFKVYRDKYNLDLYVSIEESLQDVYKAELKAKNISFDETKFITKKFFCESLKKYKGNH